MKIMFVGLGLIGGSMAMALEGYPDLERYAVDGDEPTRLEALGRGVVRAAWPNADDAPKPTSSINTISTFGAPSGGRSIVIGGYVVSGSFAS